MTEEGEIGTFRTFKNGVYHFYNKDGFISQTDNLRHATESEIAAEKERRWWNKCGREVGQIKPYDIVTHEFRKGLFEVVSVEGDGKEAFITNDFYNNKMYVNVSNLKLDTPRKYRLPVFLGRLDGERQ